MRLADLAPGKREKLERYLDLLFRFNAKFNLTSFAGRAEALEKGIEPSLEAAETVRPGKALDIGSGSGIPAVPLAVCCEGTSWTLLEPSPRKAGFLIKCGMELGLDLKVVTTTAEEHLPGASRAYSTVTVRGVRLKPRTVRMIGESLSEGGVFLLWTGEGQGESYAGLLQRAGFDSAASDCRDGGRLMTAVPRGTK